MKTVQLGIGSGAFYAGKVCEIVASCCAHHWVIMCPEHEAALCVPRAYVEPLASAIFKIGDAVRSLLKPSYGSFKGTVVGFEPKTNRVVCVSSKIKQYENDRTRFAYELKEIAHIQKFTFELNRVYGVYTDTGHFVRVRVMDHPSEAQGVILYVEETGSVFRILPKTLEKDSLAAYHITAIQEA